MSIIAFYNLKGGVGKTASAVNLAYLYSQSGQRTLLWDLDPQGASSWYLDYDTEKKFNSKKLIGGKLVLKNLVKKTRYKKLHLIPAKVSNRNFDTLINQQTSSDQLLYDLVYPFTEHYPVIILDCPPSLSYLTENIFYAADLLAMPMLPTWLSLRTYEQVNHFLKKKGYSRKKLMPFFSMVDRRKKLHSGWLIKQPEEIKQMFNSYIPYASIVEKMGAYRAPVQEYASVTPVAASYRALWKEMENFLAKDY